MKVLRAHIGHNDDNIFLYISKWKITSVDENVEKLEPLCIGGENTKWCSHCGKQFG